jgi:hypothetical protein
MPVSIESKLVGVTPARFTVLTGALSVIAGDGAALLQPASSEVVRASASAARMLAPAASKNGTAGEVKRLVDSSNAGPLHVLVPAAGRALDKASWYGRFFATARGSSGSRGRIFVAARPEAQCDRGSRRAAQAPSRQYEPSFCRRSCPQPVAHVNSASSAPCYGGFFVADCGGGTLPLAPPLAELTTV